MSTVQAGAELARQSGAITREGFGTVESSGETAGSALAAQAKAEVEAAYIVAMRRPRDLDNARDELLKAARRPSFAESAFYELKFGTTKIVGKTIRFAEEALRCFRNARVTSMVTFDDPEKRKITIRAYDLENVVWVDADVVISKTVERRQVKDGDQVIGQRINSTGQTVYIIAASDADLLRKQLAEMAKARRNLIFQIVPSWLVAEAEDEVRRTLRSSMEKDPEGARKTLLDAFSARGIKPSELKTYLGHDPAACSSAEFDELRGLLTALQDGEITWPEAMTAKGTAADAPEEDAAKAAATVEQLRAKGREVREAKAAEQAQKAEATPAQPTKAAEQEPHRRPVKGTKGGIQIEGADEPPHPAG